MDYFYNIWSQGSLTQALCSEHFTRAQRSRRGHKGQLPYTSPKVYQYGIQNVAN